ncbi:MAG: hypothetical protein IKL29_06325 [Bacteroidaceae bacterium]|nr:hypothetical protein [Bacteroidaceae bacterium]
MNNIGKKFDSLETKERFLVNAKSGTLYDLNTVPFNGNIAELCEYFGDAYPGIFLFASKKDDSYSILYKGESKNITEKIKEACEMVDFSTLGATHFCYDYESNDNIRKDILEDLC